MACERLLAGAPLASGHRPWGIRLQQLWRVGPVVAADGLWSTCTIAVILSCSAACGVFPDQGPNPGLTHWEVDSLALSRGGSPV